MVGLRHELPGILSLPSSPTYVLGLVDGKSVSGRTVPHDSLNPQKSIFRLQVDCDNG